jgi:hypothetical protein
VLAWNSHRTDYLAAMKERKALQARFPDLSAAEAEAKLPPDVQAKLRRGRASIRAWNDFVKQLAVDAQILSQAGHPIVTHAHWAEIGKSPGDQAPGTAPAEVKKPPRPMPEVQSASLATGRSKLSSGSALPNFVSHADV